MTQPELIRLPPPPGSIPPEIRASMKFAASYTRAVIENCRDVTTAVGSGVLVGIGDRLFVATAAHCIGPAPHVIVRADFTIPCEPTHLLGSGRVANRDI